ncbi:hydroxyacid dehydrogenase [Candidatus Daviesbacteria bacterium]|nr:hydroxyacid dehydrogenase [Candidatus Daviesbacteria bacterium]
MKVGFFEIRPTEKEYFEQALNTHELFFSDKPITAQNLPNTDFEILSTHTDSKVDKELLEKLPNLKIVITRTTGYDHIDLKSAKEKNIVVSYIPAYGEHTVAEFTFAILLGLSRKIPQAYNRIKQEKKFSFENLQGFDLEGKTLGVVGTGKIGANVAKIAKGFGMKILAFDAFPNKSLAQELDFSYVILEELLKNSDIITLHVPYLPSTHHLINLQNIGLIKKGAVLVNTSRGAVVETQALFKALQENILSGAALDVLEDEKKTFKEDAPITKINEKLAEMDNVIITPHTAFNTKEARMRILETTITNITSFINGSPENTIKID